MILIKKFWNFLWNIPRIKQSKKQSQRGGCGSCYYVCTHETFVIELDVLIKTLILDIEQQDEVERCILNSFNVVKIPKAIKVLSIINVSKRG